MASRIFLRPILPLTIGAGIATSGLILSPLFRVRPLRAESWSSGGQTPYFTPPQTTQSYLQRNRRQLRQITTGSLSGMSSSSTHCVQRLIYDATQGLLTGLAVSVFSKPLALLIGLVIAGLYVCQVLHIIHSISNCSTVT
jgi:hypothetical protein